MLAPIWTAPHEGATGTVGEIIKFETRFGLNPGTHEGKILRALIPNQTIICNPAHTLIYEVSVFLPHWGYTTKILCLPDQIIT
jgi:hypothetical protein